MLERSNGLDRIPATEVRPAQTGVRDGAAQREIGGSNHLDGLLSERDSLGELAELRESPGEARPRVDGGRLGLAEALPGELAVV